MKNSSAPAKCGTLSQPVPERITIKGYKSIREVDLEIRPLNVLIGANGAGKSNFVQVFKLLNDIVEERLQVSVRLAGGAANLLHHGPNTTDRIRLAFGDSPNSYEVVLRYAPVDDSLFFERERCFYQGPGFDKPYDRSLGSGHRESRLRSDADASPNKVPSKVLERLRAWRVFHFHDTSSDAAIKRKGKIDDNAGLRSDSSNLAAFLYRLRLTAPAAYQRIVAAIRLVAPFFNDFELRPNPLAPDMIGLEWSERNSDAFFDAHALSDGTLRFICLATLLLQPDLPSMIIIDEPELGLHPFAVTQLAGMLRSAATRTCVLAASQSVTLVNQLEPEEIVIVDRKDSQSTFRRVTADEIASWMDEYALGELWEKNVLGGRPTRP